MERSPVKSIPVSDNWSGDWENANLSLCKDWKEDLPGVYSGVINIRIVVVCGPDQCYDNHQRTHCEKGTRFDEHGGDRLVQSTNSNWRPGGSTEVPAMQDETDDDHQGEDDIE